MSPPFDDRPVFWRAGVIALAALAAGAPARAQGVPSFLSREVDLADFGVGRAAEVGWGRVSVVLAPEGERLEVNYLLRSAPEPATPEVAGTVAERAPGPEPAGTAPDGRGADALHSALWVWTTAELLADEQARADFLDFVEDQEIDRVFLQLVPAPGEVSAAGFVPSTARSWAASSPTCGSGERSPTRSTGTHATSGPRAVRGSCARWLASPGTTAPRLRSSASSACATTSSRMSCRASRARGAGRS